MKHYLNYRLAPFFAAFCLLLTTSCQEDTAHFDNKVFISNASKVETLLLKGDIESTESVIQTTMAKPEEKDIQITYRDNPDLVNQYNDAFYDRAIALPRDCYEIPNPVATIIAGGVKANNVTVLFKNLTQLDRDSVYVLPVAIANAGIAVLAHSRTTYFVIKGAALINTVANIKENKLNLSSPASASALNGLAKVTVEALIRVDKFGKLISTIMGIEGSFLIRIGDAGIPDNQIQLATSSGNLTDASWTVETNKWTHVALTFDSSSGEVNLYINGVKKGGAKTSGYRSNVNWGNSSFWIGYSYADDRYLEGDISECRVWNRVLTAEEINSANHFYSVDPNAEGLKAYWKFDEGVGITVNDHTGNGNNATAGKALTWKTVELPAK
jgi:hypothetical protein